MSGQLRIRVKLWKQHGFPRQGFEFVEPEDCPLRFRPDPKFPPGAHCYIEHPDGWKLALSLSEAFLVEALKACQSARRITDAEILAEKAAGQAEFDKQFIID